MAFGPIKVLSMRHKNLTLLMRKRKEFPKLHFSELETCLHVDEKPNLIEKVTFLKNKYLRVNKTSYML